MHECHLDMTKRTCSLSSLRALTLHIPSSKKLCHILTEDGMQADHVLFVLILDSAAYINNRSIMDRGFHNHEICELLFQIVMY